MDKQLQAKGRAAAVKLLKKRLRDLMGADLDLDISAWIKAVVLIEKQIKLNL